MDMIEELVKNVVRTRYEAIPQEAIRVIKRSILDTLGVLIAGAAAPGCQTVVDLMKEWGGKEESTIFLDGSKVPACHAAMANSVMARALDYDDFCEKGIHVSASAIPTALAMAEWRGGLSGKEFLTALACGGDLAVRIHFGAPRAILEGFDPVGVCTIFGTTAIAGRILGLDEEKMWHALGIALNQAAGSMQSNVDGALTVRMIQGFASRSGIQSAFLAARGITGVRNILQGRYGHFHLFSRDHDDLEALTAQLGSRFEVVKMALKKYGGCGQTHAGQEAALCLIQDYSIRPEEIEEIRVHVSEPVFHISGNSGRPFEMRENPQVDAQFSQSYAVANVVVRRSSKLEHFTERWIRDPEVLSLAQRVHPVVDKGLEEGEGGRLFARVEMRLKDGREYSKFIKYARGFPSNPMTEEEVLEKFRNCCASASNAPSPENREMLMQMSDRMEELADVTPIVSLLRPENVPSPIGRTGKG